MNSKFTQGNSTEKSKLLQRLNLTEAEFTGKKLIEGDLYLNKLTTIPEGFNPTVGGSLYLDSLTSIPEGFNPTVGGGLYLYSLTTIPEGFNPTVGGTLYLYSLTTIPEGFNPTVGGTLDLRNLTTIPEGFNPTVGGTLYLDSLTSIPEGFNPTVGGSLYLRNLTTIPEGFNPTVGGTLDLSDITSIPEGFNPTVGGTLYLDSLTSIPEGFNPTVGDSLYLRNLESKSTTLKEPITWQNGKYIKADGIFTEVVSRRGNVYKVKKLHKVEEFYLITDGEGRWSHGDTLKEAKEDLIYKITNKSKEDYKDLVLESVLPFNKAVECYRVITGACSFGVKDFVRGTNLKIKEYSIEEIIKLTEGKYGNQTFKEFFN